MTSLNGDLSQVDPSAALYLCPIISTHSSDNRVLGRLARVLAALVAAGISDQGTLEASTDNASALMTPMQQAARLGERRCLLLSERTELVYLIPAMEVRTNLCHAELRSCGFVSADTLADSVEQACPNDEAFLSDAARILEALSVTKEFKEALLMNAAEYIRILNQTAQQHMTNEPLVERIFSVIACLTLGIPDNVNTAVQVNVPYTCKWAMQQHIGAKSTLSACIFLVSTLLSDDEAQKKYICEQLVSEFLGAAKAYKDDAAFFTKARARNATQPPPSHLTVSQYSSSQVASCLGNMSLLDDCILLMCKAGTVPALIAGMNAHNSDKKLLRVGLEMISNFAAADDEEIDHEATEMLLTQGAIQQLKAVIEKHPTDAMLMRSTFDAMYNLGNDHDAAQALMDKDLLSPTLNALAIFETNKPVMSELIKLLSGLMFNSSCVLKLAQIGGMSQVLFALKAQIKDADFVSEAMTMFSNAVTNVKNAEVFLEQDYLKTILGLLDTHNMHESIPRFTMITMIRVASGSDELSQHIAEEGMMHFMRITGSHIDDTPLIRLVFELFGTLAYNKSNLASLVSGGGVQRLIQTIKYDQVRRMADIPDSQQHQTTMIRVFFVVARRKTLSSSFRLCIHSKR